jgi:hypothetical protein
MRKTGLVVCLTAVCILLAGCEEEDKPNLPKTPNYISHDYKAVDYGIGNPAKAALAVTDSSEDFYAKAVSIANAADNQVTALGAVQDTSQVYEIDPGTYTLSVVYYGEYGIWYAEQEIVRSFTVAAGGAAVYTLSGGDMPGLMYTPPGFYGSTTYQTQACLAEPEVAPQERAKPLSSAAAQQSP